MFLISWQGLGVLKEALELHKDGEGPSRLPHNGSSGERAPARATNMKGPMLVKCKAELTALCEQYYAEQGWRPPSSMV